MKWLYLFIAVIAGLGLGYWLFHQEPAVEPAVHQHDTLGHAIETEIWTCSMHPQVRQAEPGQCPICEMDLIPLSQNTADDPAVFKMSPEAVALAQIATTEVGLAGSSGDTLTLSGKIKLDERRSVSQTAHVPGRIEQLFVTFTGEQVKAGQKLATIYAPELVTAQKELLEALRFSDTNMDLAEASRNKLRNWKIDEETIKEIQSSGELIQNFTIRADRAGVVMEKRVNVGDYVQQGEALFTLADLSKLWVFFDAYEEDLPNIKIGDRLRFTTPSLPGKVFTASISFIDPLIDPQTRVAAARAEISNPRGWLKPEMFVRGSIVHQKAGSTTKLSIPKTAVLWTGKRSVVYVEVAGATIPSYEYREVKLGDRQGNRYIIEEGLQAGERIVTNGAFAIDAAAQLNNQMSMMNRNVGIVGEEESAMEVPDFHAETPPAFKEQTGRLARAYLAIKDALVRTDPDEVKIAANDLLKVLDAVDMSLVKGEAHQFWMQQLNAIATHAGAMARSADVEVQRKQFDFLSQAMIRTIKAFGTRGNDLYVQHCPMAFDNEGADWISDEEAIRNPYFGDRMLKCGTVSEVLGD